MKILIVEDQKGKRNDLRRIIEDYEDSEISVAKNYFSAKNKIFGKNKYDLIIVDMFLPDAKDKENLDGQAGKDLIFDMKNAQVFIPVLVVTQYTEYCNGESDRGNAIEGAPQMRENINYGKNIQIDLNISNDCTHYEGLHKYLSQEIPFYLGIIYYNTQSSNWEEELRFFLNKVNTRR